MSDKVYPYVVFLPKGRKQKVLEAIFGSEVPVDILKFAIKSGISEKIYQKDLIAKLKHSNKTIIDHLKTLTDLGILREQMEKSEGPGRTVWLKHYRLTDLGKWFALLLVEEERLEKERKAEIVRKAFRSYIGWIMKISEKLGIKKEEIFEIFEEEMRCLGGDG